MSAQRDEHLVNMKLIWPLFGIAISLLLIIFYESSFPLIALLTLSVLLTGLKAIESKL